MSGSFNYQPLIKHTEHENKLGVISPVVMICKKSNYTLSLMFVFRWKKKKYARNFNTMSFITSVIVIIFRSCRIHRRRHRKYHLPIGVSTIISHCQIQKISKIIYCHYAYIDLQSRFITGKYTVIHQRQGIYQHIMTKGARNPFGIMGSKSETHLHLKVWNSAGCRVKICLTTNLDDEQLYWLQIPIDRLEE